MNSVSELLEWIHEVSGHKDGCPVLFVDDGWFSDPDIYKKVELLFKTLIFNNGRFKSQQQSEAPNDWFETTFFKIDKISHLICIYSPYTL